jgi:hypothetical protein
MVPPFRAKSETEVSALYFHAWAAMHDAPHEIRTRVSALSPPCGDERAGERKPRQVRREVCAPNEVRTRVSALSPPLRG